MIYPFIHQIVIELICSKVSLFCVKLCVIVKLEMLPYSIYYKKKEIKLKGGVQPRCDKWIFDTTLYFNKRSH